MENDKESILTGKIIIHFIIENIYLIQKAFLYRINYK